MSPTTHVKGSEQARINERRVGGRGKRGGEGREVGRQEGRVVTAELRDDRLGRERGGEVADPGVKAGADEARTLIGSIDTKVGGRMGVRVKKEGVEERHGVEGGGNSVIHKGGDKPGRANGCAKDTVAGEGGSSIASEHGGCPVLR